MSLEKLMSELKKLKLDKKKKKKGRNVKDIEYVRSGVVKSRRHPSDQGKKIK